MGLAVAALLAVALADPGDPELRLGVRSEVRARHVELAPDTDRSIASALAVPWASVAASGPDLRLTAGYELELRAPDALPPARAALDVLHRGVAGLAARLPARWTLSVDGAGAYGTVNPLDLAALPRGAEPVRTDRTIRLADAAGTVAARGRLDRRTVLSLRARARYSGGVDGASRDAIPPEREAEAGAALAWNATRADVVGATIGARGGWIVPADVRAAFGTARASWRHDREAWSTWLAAGGTASWSEAPTAPVGRRAFPVGEAGARWGARRAPRLSLDVGASLGPSLDRYADAVEQRLVATGSAGWQISDAWRVELRGFALGFPERSAARASVTTAIAGIAWAPAPDLLVTLGASATRQREDAARHLPRLADDAVFLAFAWASPASRRHEGFDAGAGDAAPW